MSFLVFLCVGTSPMLPLGPLNNSDDYGGSWRGMEHWFINWDVNALWKMKSYPYGRSWYC